MFLSLNDACRFSRINTILSYAEFFPFQRCIYMLFDCQVMQINLSPQNKVLESSFIFIWKSTIDGNPRKQTGYQILTGHEYLG
jgi:hypothetical protein